ncbi:MAG: DUF1643 domain-containing protein [Flavobacteriaceae bacterium]|tara:strand:- start:5069 stop:5545 length:477 start_codon:yes stop_codon:yes gene_type:complete
MKIIRSAKFNKARTRRYSLFRKWSDKPTTVWIMLNPSVADETSDDKTISKCIKFSKYWGYGGLYVINLCSDISTCPKETINKLKINEEIDSISLRQIIDVIKKNKTVYCAWGFGISTPKWLIPLLKNKTTKALELSKSATPKHPLYLDSKLIPVKFIC